MTRGEYAGLFTDLGPPRRQGYGETPGACFRFTLPRDGEPPPSKHSITGR